MSARALWLLSLPLAVFGWAGVIVLTAALPFSPAALAAVLPMLTLALTMTIAPIVWVVGHRLRLPGAGERPASALRLAFWFGLWAALCIGLRLLGVLNGLIAITLAVVFGLGETFVQQWLRR
ncbi:MAG: hypothetical protein N2439_16055 [Anaerolineae bacterium]|nr:hypothetical protein [Anaerolineae bacterium]